MRYHSIFISFLFLFFLPSAFSQVFYGTEAQKYIKNSRSVRIQEGTQNIRYIEFDPDKSFNTPQAGVKLSSLLNLSETNTFQFKKEVTDKLGFSHFRYQQYYKGIPVEGAFYIVHSQYEKVIAANGEFFKVEEALNTIPGISGTQAVEIAIRNFPASKYYWEYDKNYKPVPELVILSDNSKSYLVYKIDIYSDEPLFRKYVYVDSHSGDILKTIDRVHNDYHQGTAVTKYEGTRTINTENTAEYFRLRDSTRGAEIVTYNMQHQTNYTQAVHYTDTDNYWDETTDQKDAATNAHFAVEKTFDYYYTVHGRNSYDNQGGALISYVNFGTQYVNAFWNGNVFTYGDGDGYNYSALTSVEVVAHEITHAVTQHSAGLEYAYEPGALNESFSDIFGVTVDYFVDSSGFNYILGDEFALLGIPFRNMANPKEYGDPDTYKGEYWVSGSNDNGGVHTNSGVQNFWFYLLAEGGEGTNDLGNSYQVSGIGIEHAAAIAYRNLTVYLTPYSQFEDARFYSIQSAVDLYGPCSEEVIAVTNAWYAVGVGEAFSSLVQAGFHVSHNYSCSDNVWIEFYNTSENASGFLWEFGDGYTSTETNPVHTYTSFGNYTVNLLAYGIDYCTGNDSIEKTDIIRVTNGMVPVSSLCQPSGLSAAEFGISGFQFGTINNSSELSAEEGHYLDFTCEHAAFLVAGHEYPLNVTTGRQQYENVSIWIDLDSNGEFSSDELIFESLHALQYHTGNVIVPEPSVFDVPLRMRVASDHASFPVTGACEPLHFGQAEDYTVYISPNAEAPTAGFELSDTIAAIGEMITLSDRSLNLPQSWSWQIPGGTPALSAEQNPVIFFDTTGVYDISLMVSNNYGTDSINRSRVVEVLPGFVTGTGHFSGSESGILWDSGGPEGSYRNGEDNDFLIQPECAKQITLFFLELDLEESYDYLYIYDGTDATGELLLAVTGNIIPEEVTAYSGSMYLRFVSDGDVNKEGFKAVWRACVPENKSIQANFSFPDLDPAYYADIQFADLSSGNPSEWLWNFGDGTFSYEQHPVHKFNRTGEVNISLFASNCFHSDTINRQIFIQEVPEMYIPDTLFSEMLRQGEISENEVTINNLSNSGDLLYEIDINERITTETIEKSGLFESDQYFVKENMYQKSHQELIFAQSNKTSQPVISYSSTDLNRVMNSFITDYHQLTDLIPGIYEFDGGIEGYLIDDGGNDMYDGGNYLSTNLHAGIAYHNNEVTENFAFGTSGTYFTSKQPGLFLMAADLDRISSFSITGNLGADGHGAVDGSIVTVHKGLQTYTGFVKRVSGSGDPSVNHLIIVPSAGNETSHTFQVNSNFDDHTVFGLEPSSRIYYLLFSTLNGSYVSDSVIEAVMESFIQLITPQCEWLTAESDNGIIEPLSSSGINLFANAGNLPTGSYSADIHIRSNDTAHSEIVISYHLTVNEALPPALEVTDSLYYQINTNEIKEYEFAIGNENGGSKLEYSLEILNETFGEDWLEIVTNAEGIIEAGETKTGILRIDASNLMAGRYIRQLTLYSNDPVKSVNYIQVILQVIENATLLTDNFTGNSLINVYPNPATDILNIAGFSSMEYHKIEVCIVSMAGGLIRSSEYLLNSDLANIVMPVTDLKPGVYILNLTGDGNLIQSIRFVKK